MWLGGVWCANLDGMVRACDAGLVAQFPSMRAADLRRVLERAPLGYQTVRQSGSHRRMESLGRPALTFAFHDGVSLPPGLVRKVLCSDVGLAESEALALVN